MYRNAGLAAPLAMPTVAANVANLTGAGNFQSANGHSQWEDGRSTESGFTTTFAPDSVVLANEAGVNYDIDWTNELEGKSTTIPTYSAVTARSYHMGGVNGLLMDGSVHFYADLINLGVWQAAFDSRRPGAIAIELLKPLRGGRSRERGLVERRGGRSLRRTAKSGVWSIFAAK